MSVNINRYKCKNSYCLCYSMNETNYNLYDKGKDLYKYDISKPQLFIEPTNIIEIARLENSFRKYQISNRMFFHDYWCYNTWKNVN